MRIVGAVFGVMIERIECHIELIAVEVEIVVVYVVVPVGYTVGFHQCYVVIVGDRLWFILLFIGYVDVACLMRDVIYVDVDLPIDVELRFGFNV